MQIAFVFLIMMFIAINGPIPQMNTPNKYHIKTVVPFSWNCIP